MDNEEKINLSAKLIIAIFVKMKLTRKQIELVLRGVGETIPEEIK